MEQYELQVDFNGAFVRLPEQFRDKRGVAKIILMTEDNEPPPRKKPSFNAFRIDTTGFRFNREEANER